MKHYWLLLVALMMTLTVQAQKEVDFADRFMQLYGAGTTVKCNTVSPAMVQRLLQNEATVKDKNIEEALNMIRTVRVVYNSAPAETAELYKKAEELLKANKKRYHFFDEYDKKSVYTRKKGNMFVEIILFNKAGKQFQMVDVTGSIPVAYINKLMKAS